MEKNRIVASERHPQYEELLEQIEKMKPTSKCKCPDCGTSFGNRHGLRVHFVRKHGGIVWGRPFDKNKKTKRAYSKKPGARKPGRVAAKKPGSDAPEANFCPCCGFSMSVLRTALRVAEGISR